MSSVKSYTKVVTTADGGSAFEDAELLQSNTALTQQDKELTERVAELTEQIHALLTQRAG